MQTRRQVLLGGGTALATTLAGCNSLPGIGGDSDSESESGFDPLKAIPASIGTGPGVRLTLWDFGQLSQYDGVSLDWAVGGPCWNPDPSEYDVQIRTSSARNEELKALELWTGTFDKTAFRESIQRTRADAYRSLGDLEESGTVGEFDLYEAGDSPSVLAISDEAAIVASSRELVDAALAAEAGDEDRYVDENSIYEVVQEQTAYRDLLSLEPADSEDPYVAIATAVEAGSDQTEATGLYIFEDAKAAESADIDMYSDFSEEYVDSTSLDGRAGIVTGTLPTEELFSGYESEVPAVHFEFEYDADARTLTITHECGDFVQAGNLEITGIGGRGPTWAELDPSKDAQSDVSGGDSIVLGDTAETEIPPDYRISITWSNPETRTRTGIAYDSGPEAQ